MPNRRYADRLPLGQFGVEAELCALGARALPPSGPLPRAPFVSVSFLRVFALSSLAVLSPRRRVRFFAAAEKETLNSMRRAVAWGGAAALILALGVRVCALAVIRREGRRQP